MKIEIKNPLEFIFSGRAEFIIENEITKNSFRYKISKNRKDENLYFVYLFVDDLYVYSGFFREREDSIEYVKGNKGALDKDSKPILGLKWIIQEKGKPLRVLHIGKCGKCGDYLESEEDIERGFHIGCYERNRIKGHLAWK